MKPARRKRRVGRDVLAGLAAAAARQLLSEPEDSPRRKPTLASLKFMREAADEPRADAAADRRTP